MRAGASEFLTKPIQREALLAAVELAVERDVALRRAPAPRAPGTGATRIARAARTQGARRHRRGKLHKQIAPNSAVSERTIKVTARG
jgi:FixJ family two-component response regulator